ncbi:unnamed protein product (macronuclear) [Paramecium tetraurelia]|uniref:Uncharacterized protein n=1 Tax=Paramecium tetraurelia TaxID=5888 RepID=A0DFF2_PARTE|nr:uncharacterized protein GSPATT00016582001 [Paramecium tetraurelia]CAK81769.1 unnamed protein product [Paramecium tetraurelia]|eukprot:XP_001449166.1 hypothetical protein (macronuclear) [Paramecium tetraurelia strain d4-2]
MRILVIAVLALSVMAAQKKRKATPNLIHIDNKAYQQSHAQIEYDVDSFTSPRTQQLKTAQKKQDSSLKKAIQHSQQTGFVQIQQETDQFILMNQDEDLSSELMTEQQVQQALLTAEDFNNVPNIEMQAESNYQAPDVAQDDVNESYYIPVVTEGDGTLEEVQNSDEEPQQNPDIEMPSLDEASSSFLQ